MNAIYEKRREQMFPKLAPPQIARLEALGTRSATRAGEVLVEPGERQQRLLVVLDGSLEVEHGAERVTLLEPGDFSGELYLQRVREHIESGERSGVRGTPGFFVNGAIQDVSFGLQLLFQRVERVLEAKPA